LFIWVIAQGEETNIGTASVKCGGKHILKQVALGLDTDNLLPEASNIPNITLVTMTSD
jgi:hypothetical protein